MAEGTELREIVRRVVGRVLAERGRTSHPAGRGEAAGAARTGGVHVDLRPRKEPPRPAETEEAPAGGRGAPLVTASCLSGIARGGVLRVPPGAIVTDLAREEAWKRGIALVQGGPAAVESRSGGRLRIAIG